MPLLAMLGVAPGLESALPVLAVAAHLFGLAAVGLLCHGRLAELRPPAERLTGFYLHLSLGGLLGGAVDAIAAPALLDRVLEYPLALAAACLVAPGAWGAPFLAARTGRLARWAAAALPAALLGGLMVLVQGSAGRLGAAAIPVVRVGAAAAAGLAALMPRPALALVVLTALGVPLYTASLSPVFSISLAEAPRLVGADRDFYGALRVVEADGRRVLLHGQTVHGTQLLDPARGLEMGLYYHPQAGGGRLIAAMRAMRAAAGAPPMEVVAVGLGAGVMACYGGPDLRMAFVEISPAVLAAARRHFTFLRDCGDPAVEIGDGRLLLAARPAASLDLVVLDAYSGGAVPVHTATVEALGIYLDRLRPGGALAFHVSNRSFDLAPFVAAAAARHGASALVLDTRVDASSAVWVAVTRDGALAARLASEGWSASTGEGRRPWQDDRWDLLRALRL